MIILKNTYFRPSLILRRKIKSRHFDEIQYIFCRDREAIFSQSCLEEEEKFVIKNFSIYRAETLSRNPEQESTRVARCTRANKRKRHSPLLLSLRR